MLNGGKGGKGKEPGQMSPLKDRFPEKETHFQVNWGTGAKDEVAWILTLVCSSESLQWTEFSLT